MQNKLITLDGFHAVKHALRFNADIVDILSTNTELVRELAAELAPDIEKSLAQKIQSVPIEEFRKLSNPPHPTGVAALAKRPQFTMPLMADRSAPVVLLENPKHLGNIGAVIRVAAAAGASGVATTGEVDPWNPTVVRGSAGLHYALPVSRLGNATELSGPLIIFDPEGESLRSFKIPDNAILAFGTERHGVSEALKQRADYVASLPMQPGVSSLNLSTSVAAVLYYWRLQTEY